MFNMWQSLQFPYPFELDKMGIQTKRGVLMKVFIVISLLLFSYSSLACIGAMRVIGLENSPFFFDTFTVHGTSFSIPFSGGQQTASFSCDRTDNNTHQLFVEATDDQSTPEEDAFERTPMSTLTPNGQTNAIRDSKEVPMVTTISDFFNEADRSTFTVRSTTSENYLKVTCKEGEDRVNTMVVEFMGPDDNRIAVVGAAHNSSYRGIGINEANASVDMANLTPQAINIPGCGGVEADLGGGSQDGGTTGVNR